jgi:1-phosphofructokinase
VRSRFSGCKPSRAAEQLAGQGADHVVVSRASEGVLAYLDGRVLTMTAPTLDVVDPKGAGDSMTGAFAAALARGNDLETAIRLGAAAGALNTTRHGLASGTRREIEALVDYVQVEEQ